MAKKTIIIGLCVALTVFGIAMGSKKILGAAARNVMPKDVSVDQLKNLSPDQISKIKNLSEEDKKNHMNGSGKKISEMLMEGTNETEAIPVEISKIESNEVYKSIYSVGEVDSMETVTVSALTNGEVLETYFEIGDTVHEGEVLYTLESETFDNDMTSKLEQARNGVIQSKNAYETSHSNYERVLELYNQGIASRLELDNAKNGLDNAQIAYENSMNSYDSLNETYKTNSENYTVISPVTGVVTAKSVSEGIFASNQSGYTIKSSEGFKIRTLVSSNKISKVEKNQIVEIFIPTLDKSYVGHVDTISLQGNGGFYPVDIVFDMFDEAILPDLYAEVNIITEHISEGVWVTNKALIQDGGKNLIYTIDDNKAIEHQVEILSTRGDMIAVSGNLLEGQSVVTLGKEYLINGSNVEVIE